MGSSRCRDRGRGLGPHLPPTVGSRGRRERERAREFFYKSPSACPKSPRLNSCCFNSLSLSLFLRRDHRRRQATRPAEMTTSRRLADRKTAKFQKNITKRGSVPETTVKKGNDYPVGPLVLGFFIFVVIGSSLFQIIRTATSGGMA
ncbi:hypothetical protein DAI22_11g209101 [Oryza sativa Japonica Group]|nr:hypothetical protein DAI22_11g209101 [Oryza sativa Japonica Group]